MSRQFIAEYLAELNRLVRVSGASRETVVREAFKDLLKRYARQKDLVFLAEYPLVTSRKKNIAVDGAIVHSLRVPLGYWEAKDAEDDLDEEIEKKFRAGYPQDNIIFEDTRIAVLIQNKNEVLRCAVDDETRLMELMELFFGYERPEIGDFRKAVAQFRDDLPAITSALNDLIEKAGATLPDYQKAEAKFLSHAKGTINPAITTADIREMLMQHILTEDIFAHVFNDSDFHRKNTVASELYALENTFFTGGLKRDTLRALDSYYAAIKANAAQITSHHEKQKFLKVIYENFYKVYNPKAADRLGVVYTPNEIVKFMIDGADWLCQQHFGKALIDPGVEILDPATGTGTFVCELLEKFRGAHPAKLHHKYREEIHANEVAILPYYVANLNIEATYYAIAQQYAEYPNLCFVDTLDNVAGLGKFSGFQEDLFGAVSEGNVARIKRQNKRKISVIIGNPPYNANQQNENDNNKNRDYPVIDARIKATYIKESTAQKTKQYDMFVRFIRWAADRVNDEGIIAFVVNRKFIDGKNFDGFRKVVGREFDEFRIVDLGGDYKIKGVGGGGNVFGIGTGVAIFFAVRRKKIKSEHDRATIYYSSAPSVSGDAKLSWLSGSNLPDIKSTPIRSDESQYWIDNVTNDWTAFIESASKDTKSGKAGSRGKAIFELFSLGVVTNRDEWVYDFNEKSLASKVDYLIKVYTDHIAIKDKSKRSFSDIKWTRLLKALAAKSHPLKLSGKFVPVLFRPFTRKTLYRDRYLNEMLYRNDSIYSSANEAITISQGQRGDFQTLATRAMPSLDTFLPNACASLPRYRHTNTGERIDNITDWALDQFRAHYGAKAALTKDAIFHYVYAVLHDPLYRDKYALNLKREFPRIPFSADFPRWAAWGEQLMALHVGFESVAPWPLQRLDAPDERSRAAGLAPKTILRADAEAGLITLDSETQLTGVPPEAFAYRLGNRSALDWILDQHKEKTPKDPTIREKFNTYRFADHKEKVVDLLARVTRVSMETVAITEAMKTTKR
jgi:predicted helicase